MSVGESYPVFQCPKCRQYISTKYDECRFCNFPLSDEIKAQAIAIEVDGNRQYRLKMSKGVLYAGLGILALGLLLSLTSIYSIFIAGEGVYFLWSPIIVLAGLGQILIGLNGIRVERKKITQ